MVQTIRFPKQSNVIFEAAEAYRRLSPTDRFLAILELIGFGEELMAHSPNREAALRLQLAEETEWQRIQKELFAKHVARSAANSD